MKSNLTQILLAAACLVAPALATYAQEAAAPAAQPAAQPPAVRVVEGSAQNEPVVSMSFDETPLADVIKAFRDATGANIISGGTNLQGTVSVRLDNVAWKKGLTSILDQQGLQLVEQPAESGIYVVSAKSALIVPKITQTFPLVHTRAEDVATLFKSTLGATGTVTPFPSANVVIVTATEQQVAECEKIIASIDKPRTQVYIEARFVELNAKARKSLGLKWDSLEEWSVGAKDINGGFYNNNSQIARYRTGGTVIREGVAGDEEIGLTLLPENLTGGTIAGTTADDMSWRRIRSVGGLISASDFALTISAFEQLDGVSIFSNPKVIVANEETARVDMTTKEPNVEVSFQAATSDNGSDSITTRLALIPGKDEPFVGEAFFSYGISLKVTPRVSSSGLITVEVEPSISERAKKEGNNGYFEIQGINSEIPMAKYPIINISRIKSVFTMDNGKTAVIGGLTRTTESNVDSGIPVLRELPWIGQRLFGWKSRSKDQSEIIIFVTVGIADPVEMSKDVGLPKNALFGREVVEGKLKEPGDRTLSELMSLEDPRQQPLQRAPEQAPEAAAPKAAE